MAPYFQRCRRIGLLSQWRHVFHSLVSLLLRKTIIMTYLHSILPSQQCELFHVDILIGSSKLHHNAVIFLCLLFWKGGFSSLLIRNWVPAFILWVHLTSFLLSLPILLHTCNPAWFSSLVLVLFLVSIFSQLSVSLDIINDAWNVSGICSICWWFWRFMGSQRVGHDWVTELNWCLPAWLTKLLSV